MIPDILEASSIHTDDIPAGTDLTALIRGLNASGVEVPWAWSVSTGPTDPMSHDRKTLTVGIDNSVGILIWATGSTRHVPTTGTDDEWQTYCLGGLYDIAVPPHAEVPLDTVFEALSEFLDTKALPTCVTWQPVAE
ncbi:MAG TPA: Imm1 family immunity protein [Actinokineospora sp.]|jgi:hypothetical protein|nr:Imm1 family immunity protein [Actinokineospora sp.]